MLGSNTYSGGTAISAGTLQVGNGGSGEYLASPSVGLSNSAALVFNHADALTYSGLISGLGGLTQTGTGVLTLLGSNTYSGGTTVSGGTLQVGNGGSGEYLASPSVSLSNSAALVFNHADALTYSGVISGNGGLTQTGTGILTLLGSNTYSGGTAISAGTLQVGNGGSGEFLASPGVSLGNSAALVFNHADTLTYTGVISGNGGLTQTGPGLLTLLGSNTYSGGTAISAGTLQVGNGGSGEFLASPSVSLSNSAALVFNHADTLTYSGVISGNGTLIQTGAGVLTLLGSNTYSGGTTVSAGTLQVGNGGSGEFLASPSVSLSNNTGLVFNHADALTYGGVISGNGVLTQTGAGILTLSGSNTYSGGTMISAGAISLNNAGAAQNSTVTVGINNGLLFNSNSGAIATFNVGELAGSGSITLADGSYAITLSAGGNGASTTYSGVLGGAGSLAKTGSGILTLLGSNTYGGGTTVSAGTLQVGSGAFLASPTVSLGNGATLCSTTPMHSLTAD